MRRVFERKPVCFFTTILNQHIAYLVFVKKLRSYLIFLLLGVFVYFQSNSQIEKELFHSAAEIAFFKNNGSGLPKGENSYFVGSGRCEGCHGHDEQGIAYITASGQDVNVVEDWETSMMALSARDPFWIAKVSHEGLVNPDHKAILEDKCTSCHAPLGHFNAHFLGQEHYSLAEVLQDSFALDGVSCVGCHQIADPGKAGPQFSGKINYDTTGVVFGPYEDPLVGPMELYAGYTPVESYHISNSELCASCHTLETETVDLEGNFTGETFVEQATYHEWLNSSFSTNDKQCQSCHLPRIKDEVIIADVQNLEPRSPFGLHHMVGANAFMLKIMKDYSTLLGIPAEQAQFDTTIARTVEMLQQQSLKLELTETEIANDTAYYALNIENLAGHKFPSGYPARRAFVEFTLRDVFGDTLFISGQLDENYEVVGMAETYEEHYDVITQESQVQIYEMVLGDVNNDVTTVLERAATSLKDNRLPPAGFKKSHSEYSMTEIAGNALSDGNFNKVDEAEGCGCDVLNFAIPLNGYNNPLNATAKVYYQSAPPKWMEDMFTYQSEEIILFKGMYDNADQAPILVKEITIGETDFWGVGIDEIEKEIAVFPNPIHHNHFNFQSEHAGELQLYDVQGRLQFQQNVAAGSQQVQLNSDLSAGTYLLIFTSQSGDRFLEKLLVF